MEQYIEHDGFWRIQCGRIIQANLENPHEVLNIISHKLIAFAEAEEMHTKEIRRENIIHSLHRMIHRVDDYSLNEIKDVFRVDRKVLYIFCEDQNYELILNNLLHYLAEPYPLAADAHLAEQFTAKAMIPRGKEEQYKRALQTDFWWCVDPSDPSDLDSIGDWIAFVGHKKEANGFSRSFENYYNKQWLRESAQRKIELISKAYSELGG